MTVRDRLDLNPPLAPYREYWLDVGGHHNLYVEESAIRVVSRC